MRDIEDWKREQLKNIKFRAAYNALAEEFALAEKKIKARKKKRVPAYATSLKPVPLRGKRRKNPHYGSTFDSFLKEAGILDQVNAAVKKRVGRRKLLKPFRSGGN
jgi:hypothetical protein